MRADALRFSDDGKTLFAAYCDHRGCGASVGDPETGKVKHTTLDVPEAERDRPRRPLFVTGVLSPNGEVTVIGMQEHVIRLFETRTGKEIVCLKGPAKDFLAYEGLFHGRRPWPSPIFFSEDGSRLISVAVFGKRLRPGRPHRGKTGNVQKTTVTAWDVKQYTGASRSGGSESDVAGNR
jgi:hypothetical protein